MGRPPKKPEEGTVGIVYMTGVDYLVAKSSYSCRSFSEDLPNRTKTTAEQTTAIMLKHTFTCFFIIFVFFSPALAMSRRCGIDGRCPISRFPEMERPWLSMIPTGRSPEHIRKTAPLNPDQATSTCAWKLPKGWTLSTRLGNTTAKRAGVRRRPSSNKGSKLSAVETPTRRDNTDNTGLSRRKYSRARLNGFLSSLDPKRRNKKKRTNASMI